LPRVASKLQTAPKVLYNTMIEKELDTV